MQPPRQAPAQNVSLALSQALRAGDWAAAEAMLLRLTKKEKRNPEPHFQLGMVLRRQGREREAAKAFSRALKINPRLPQVEFERGQALFALDELREARRAFLAALKLAPGDVGCRANLAMIARLQGDLDEAVRRFDDVLAERGLPENQVVMLRLGLIEALRDKGDFERMRAEASTLAEAQPQVRSSIITLLSHGRRGRMPLKAAAI